MPLPVAHSLAAAAIYVGLDADGRWQNVKRLLLAMVIAVAPDFDMIPGILIGEPARFHHGPSHSLGFVVVAAVVAALAASAIGGWPLRMKALQGAAATAAMVGLLWASHIVLDAFTQDFRDPVGVPMFWPLSSAPVQVWPYFPYVEKLGGQGSALEFVASIMTPHNLWAVAVEALTMVPLVLVVAWWRRRAESSGVKDRAGN